VHFIDEIPSAADYLFHRPETRQEASRALEAQARLILEHMENCESFDAININNSLREASLTLDIKMSDVLKLLRIIIAGGKARYHITIRI
jgi:hypothetical protein